MPPDTVRVRVAQGQSDAAAGLADGLDQIEGDYAILAKMCAWFAAAGGMCSLTVRAVEVRTTAQSEREVTLLCTDHRARPR